MRPFEYIEPRSLADACSLLHEHKEDAKIIAGGQSLLPILKHRLVAPGYIIGIKGLKDLEYITEEDGEVKIGALTTHRAIETFPLVKEKLPILAEMERTVGSVQIRNWGTIGGSLCHADPGGDAAPVLIALKAKVKAVSVRGERVIDLESFFTNFLETVLEPDEILVEIQVPKAAPHTAGIYHKESVRAGDMGIAGVAAVVSLDEGQGIVKDARIVLGAVGPTPIRAKEAERVVIGTRMEGKWTQDVGEAAAREARPTEDVHGSIGYKLEIVKVLTSQVISQAVGRAKLA